MKNRIKNLTIMLALMMAFTAGCGSSKASGEEAPAGEVKTDTASEEKVTADIASTEEVEEDVFAETTITVFAAKSLNTVMEELIAEYNKMQPNVTVVGSYDSSGTLMTQIEEGAACDVFFSAAQKQMDQLEEEGLIVGGTRHNVVNNQVCVVTYNGSDTAVTGLETLSDASSFALADGSVPVGKYTRQALVNAGILKETEDVSQITTATVSEALGGVEINECANVGAVAAAVAEGSNEVGTVYYSDTYGYEERLKILEIVSYDLTGNVIYPVGQVINKEADETEQVVAADFIDFLVSDKAKEIYESYYFDTNVE